MAVSIWIYSGIFLLLSFFVFWIAPKVEIIPHLLNIDETAVKSLKGVKRINWDDGSLLFEMKLIGPESISHDPVTGDIFTGTADGLLWKINKDLTHAEVVLRIGEDHPECGLPEYQMVCGRILGLKFVAADKVIVADAYKGIIAVHVNSKKKQILIQPDKNMQTRSLKIFNSVDVSREGLVYFTVSSMKWYLHDFLYSVFEGDSTGRLYSYNLVTQELNLLISNLTFANGLVISHGEDFLLVAECTNRRILKVDLRYPTKTSVFIDNLPGPVDNIKKAFNGKYLVAIVSVSVLRKLAFFASHPSLNTWAMWLIPKWVLSSLITYDSKVLLLDREGKIDQVIEGNQNRIKFITEAYEIEDTMILGSFKNPFLVVIKKSKDDLNFL